MKKPCLQDEECEREYRKRVEPLIARAMDGGALLKRIANEEAAAADIAEDATYKLVGVFVPGDIVRLTVPALNAMLGSRRLVSSLAFESWVVVECACDLCALGRFVALDESTEYGARHISKSAVEHVGQPGNCDLPPEITAADTAAISVGISKGFKR